ncbi:MAG TPA: sigma-54-dependent Fis family transcriptional regulator [Pirellulales bacterium]|nr:sigma-54-dependent Fis family transcriptional regulator [Pirellulales bacterium]
MSSPPALSPIVAQLLTLANQQGGVEVFLAAGLPLVAAASQSDFVAVAHSAHGQWTVVAETGPHQALPGALLSDALDSEIAVARGTWLAVPTEPHAATSELLVLHHIAGVVPVDWGAIAETLAPICGQALAAVRERQRERSRVRRLEAILEIAGRWNQNQGIETLLVEMAEAATRLLEADRASIFLWDKANHVLVGRPALGVAGNELRIPDNFGIVGQVIASGEPRRVDLTNGQEQINRKVDEQTGYRTRTLLCVPLRGRNGERFGAFETINKKQGDFTDDDLATLVELAAQAAVVLENVQEREDLLKSRRLMTEQAAQGVQLVGKSPAIEALRSTIRRVANTDLAVLILGENGTGKEVVAQAIHYFSNRRDQPFIAVNFAALTETLLESELFGHEKGAFTDAHESRPGKFELASGGTLFLDEIGDFSLGGQSKLLRVLEEKVVVRVGGSRSIHTDARLIAATNQNLAEMVGQKRFREDLYYRLNVVVIQIPPLRERPDDIWPLAEHFLNDFCKRARRKPPKFTADARQRLERHSWPGNVRELRNLMERLAYLSPGDRIESDDPMFTLNPPGPAAAVSYDLPLAEATNCFQTDYIRHSIERYRGNMSEVARHLALHRSNLYRKMRQLGMNGEE